MQESTEVTLNIRPIEPVIEINELTSQQLKTTSDSFEGGFNATVSLPNKKISDISPIFNNTEIWEVMFKLVELKFLEPKIYEGLTAEAKARLEKNKGIYEIFKIELNEEAMTISVRLKNCKENTERDIFFEAMVLVLKFAQKDSGIDLNIDMLYQRKGHWLLNKVKDTFVIDIKVIVREALEHAMHMAFSRICAPETFPLRKMIQDADIITKIPKEKLSQKYSYGIKGTLPIATSPNELLKVLYNKKNYHILHKKFEIDNDGIRLNLLNSYFLLDLKTNLSKQKIKLISKTDFIAAKAIEINFEVHAKDEKSSTLMMSFLYDLKLFTGFLEGTVDQLAEKLIRTTLRHVAMNFPSPSYENYLQPETKIVAMI